MSCREGPRGKHSEQILKCAFKMRRTVLLLHRKVYLRIDNRGLRPI